jgi:hypothetical protein
MKYSYYFNNVPGFGLCRNNLIYTSLISDDNRTFVQWYYNDTDYHNGKNQVIDPSKMDEKWERELKYLQLMRGAYPNLVPTVLDIDIKHRKIYLAVDGPDFWEQSSCNQNNYDKIVPDWQDQMIEIFQAHRTLGLWKYSLHPSSYFVVDGKLKSINYFFTYRTGEGPITVRDHLSHISEDRQREMKIKTDQMNIDWDTPYDLKTMQQLTFESFRNNYPADFIERAKNVFL